MVAVVAVQEDTELDPPKNLTYTYVKYSYSNIPLPKSQQRAGCTGSEQQTEKTGELQELTGKWRSSLKIRGTGSSFKFSKTNMSR